MPLLLATRPSSLAVAQARLAAGALQAAWPALSVELLEVSSRGDKDRFVPVAALGGKGAFIKEVEAAVLDKRASFAIHSLKDMTVDIAPGTEIVAVLPRARPWDVFVVNAKRSKGPSWRVGTGSARRAAEWLRLHPEDEVVAIRGNVETRLARVLGQDAQATGLLDAVVLARAGLDRLGIWPEGARELAPDEMLPAACQGIIALQAREGDDEARALAAAVNCESTMACALAERAVIRALGADCGTAVGVLGVVEGGVLRLRARVLAPRGTETREASLEGVPRDAEALGEALARELLQRGAGSLIRAGHAAAAVAIVTRDEGDGGPLAAALARRGARVVSVPTVAHEEVDHASWLDGVGALESFDWVVLTSARGAAALRHVARGEGALPLAACAGEATAFAARAAGLEAAIVSTHGVEGLASLLRERARTGDRLLYLRAEAPASDLAALLARGDLELVERAVYRTRASGDGDRLRDALRGAARPLVVFCSPSAVEGFVASSQARPPAAVIGPSTRMAALQAGFVVVAQPASSTIDALAGAVMEWFAGA